VKWFEKHAAKHKMYLAWSCACKAFAVYTKRAGKFCVQKVFSEPNEHGDIVPIPLGAKWLSLLVSLQRTFYAQKGSLSEAIIKYERDAKQKKQDDMMNEMRTVRNDVIRKANLSLGRLSPIIASYPKTGAVIHGS